MIEQLDKHVGHLVKAQNGFVGLLTERLIQQDGYAYNVHFDNFVETYTKDGKVFLDGTSSCWDIVEVLPKEEVSND